LIEQSRFSKEGRRTAQSISFGQQMTIHSRGLRSALMLGLSTLALHPVTAAAQSAKPADEKIVVTGSPIARSGDRFSKIVTSVGRDEALKNGGADLGTALQQVPGVSGTGFAAGSNRPVLRGFDATRVLVTENGLGSHDVAELSPDHGTPADVLSAAKIEILRGAATLRYGSQAIGGVVNVINGRIPDRAEAALSGEIVGVYTSVANGGDGAFQIQGGADVVRFHVDAYRRSYGDYGIHDGDQPNSFAKSDGFSMGGAFVGGQGSAGLAYSKASSEYGLPSSDTKIVMDSRRVQARGIWDIDAGALQKITVEAAGTDYRHDEVEPDGTAAATFLNDERDLRVEAIFGALGPLSDLAFGVQGQHRDLSALGEGEDFLAPSVSESLAAYVFARAPLSNALDVEASVRVENATRDGVPVSGVPVSVEYTPFSAALGLVWDVSEPLTLGLTATTAARAPGPAELFARGPHEGTGTYEIGDPNLKTERANSLEATVRWATDNLDLHAAAWWSGYRGFVYSRLTGNTCDDAGVCILGPGEELKEVFIDQDGAALWGFEAQGKFTLGEAWGGGFGMTAQADYVSGELDGGQPIPRLTPFRFGGGLFFESAVAVAQIKVLRVSSRDDTAPFETPTDGYVDIGANVSWRLYEQNGSALDVTVSGRNLANVEQRNAVSFVKDDVVMPGRDVRLIARLTF
jgi:iron complex outermembrane receptor protein